MQEPSAEVSGDGGSTVQNLPQPHTVSDNPSQVAMDDEVTSPTLFTLFLII